MTASGYLVTAVGLRDPVLPPPASGMISVMQGYVGDADPRDPLVSPVFGDYTGVTPLFLLSGTAEVLASDAPRVAARARGQGVNVTLLVLDGMWHVPIANGTGVPELQLAYDEMIKFFKRHCLVAGAMLYFFLTEERPVNATAFEQILQFGVVEGVFLFFALNVLMFLWAVARPKFLETVLFKAAVRLIITTLLLVVGAAIWLIFVSSSNG